MGKDLVLQPFAIELISCLVLTLVTQM